MSSSLKTLFYLKRHREMQIQNMMELMAMTTDLKSCPVSTIKEKCPPCTDKVGKQGNKPMCYECDCEDYKPNPELKKISDLMSALYDVQSEKNTAFRKQFKLDEDTPKKVEDMIERIKAGDFQIKSEEFRKERTYWNQWDFIIWRKPGEDPDQDGFNAAIKAMDKAFDEAAIRIRVLPPVDGLAALDTFKAWTLEGNAK